MQGVLAPAGTPKEIVNLLQREIAAILALPDVKEKVLALGFEPSGMHAGRVRRLHQGRDREVAEGDRGRRRFRRFERRVMPKKPTTAIPYLKPRAITDALRQQVRKELPEVAQIADTALQRKVVEAWAFALAHSSFKSIREIPPAGNPDTMRPSAAIRPTTCAA